MAVSGLEQRYPPMILTTSMFAPWGPGVLTPWSYEEDDDGPLDANVESKPKQKELRRTHSWGGFATFKQKARSQPAKNPTLEQHPPSALMKHSAPATRKNSMTSHNSIHPSLSRSDVSTNDASSTVDRTRSDSKDSDTSRLDLSCSNLIEAISNKEPDCQTLPDCLIEAISKKKTIRQTVQTQEIVQKPMPIADDSSTTLALRNLPYSLTRAELLEALNASGFAGLYDFVYLPHKFKEHRNLGFAFINFANVDAAHQFHAVWHKSRHFKVKGSVKPLNVSVAEVQGRSANELKAQSRKMGRVRNGDFLPFVFAKASIPVSLDYI